MKKLVVLSLLVLFVSVAAYAAASQIAPSVVPPIDDSIIASILGGALFGIPFSGLIEVVKRALKKVFKIADDKVPAWLGYVASAVVIGVMDVIVLSGLKMLTIPNALTAGLIAWLIANGFYKETVKAPFGK